MRTQKRPFCKNTEAVSEVIGEVLLTAIAVLAFSIIAVFVFSYADPGERVHADIDGWVNVNADTIVFRHAGGESIELEKIHAILNLNGSIQQLSSAEFISLAGSDIWQLGEMIIINTSSLWSLPIGQNDSISAAIIHRDSNMVIKSGNLLGFESVATSGNNSGNNSGNVTPPQPPELSAPSDQIAWWRLNENTGTAASDSVGGYDGSIIAGASWTTGINGSALDFDDTNYVEINEAIISAYPFTISTWVQTTASGSDQAIANLADSSSNKKYSGIYVDSNGQASLVGSNPPTQIITGSSINDGSWHHVIGVFSSPTDRTLYVDGVFNGTDTAQVTFNSNVGTWNFGRLGKKTPDSYFNGTIDEVKLWDRALNATEVQQLYLNP